MLNTNAVRTLGIVENRYFVGYLRIQKVSTHPDNHAKKAVHVAATWGRLALVPTERHFGLSIHMNFDNLSQLPQISLCNRRCDKLLFMSTMADDTIGSIAIPNITNGRDSFWNKTKKVPIFQSILIILFAGFCSCVGYL